MQSNPLTAPLITSCCMYYMFAEYTSNPICKIYDSHLNHAQEGLLNFKNRNCKMAGVILFIYIYSWVNNA
jgi:hypothetical protein